MYIVMKSKGIFKIMLLEIMLQLVSIVANSNDHKWCFGGAWWLSDLGG